MVRASEPAEAAGTGEGFLPRVRQHVRFQMARQAEALPTFLAGVRSQVRVTSPVLAQITGGRVTAVAVGTLEGLLPRMYSLVLDQIPGLREALIALGALVRSFSGVGALVIL